MKRSPLKRTSSLKRSPMRRRKGTTKYARRERDWAYMGWVKQQPCVVGGWVVPFALGMWCGSDADACSGPIEAHHAGVHGVGQKAGDDTCIPLCSAHHRALTDRSGAFAGWPRGAVKLWELEVIQLCRTYARSATLKIDHNPEW